MAIKEPAINDAIAELLDGMYGGWSVHSELTGQLRGSATKTPDILIRTPGRLSVVVENEFDPAVTVDLDATNRLNVRLKTGESLQVAIALITPAELKKCGTSKEARAKLANRDDFRYALHTPDQRFPEGSKTYLSGSLRDLALLALQANVETDALRRAISILEDGVTAGVRILMDVVERNEGTKQVLANTLKQTLDDQNIEQALGIASTVVVNAMVFQERLAGHHTNIRTLAEMRVDDALNGLGLLSEWQRVLDINYWSIFGLAMNLLRQIKNPKDSKALIDELATTAATLASLGVSQSHDLAGVVFQRMITQRKFLAAFYTRPESATLLTHLAIPDDARWADNEHYTQFRAADYACGTGTLIHGAYDRIAQLHSVHGGDPSVHHAHMMENALTGADIVPSAAHLTASMLSSVFPQRAYTDTRILVPAYGAVRGKGVRLGSVELLSSAGYVDSLLNLSHDRVTGYGEEEDSLTTKTPRRSQDLVIMNPPFTRAMSEWLKGGKGTVKQYRALGTTKRTQKQMLEREKRLCGPNPCFNGYQALPSAFCGVADTMVKPGGTIALVLPLTAAQSISWSKFREVLSTKYSDVLAVAIASAPAREQAWSSDTDLVEVLIIATKRERERETSRSLGVDSCAAQDSDGGDGTSACHQSSNSRITSSEHTERPSRGFRSPNRRPIRGRATQTSRRWRPMVPARHSRQFDYANRRAASAWSSVATR